MIVGLQANPAGQSAALQQSGWHWFVVLSQIPDRQVLLPPTMQADPLGAVPFILPQSRAIAPCPSKSVAMHAWMLPQWASRRQSFWQNAPCWVLAQIAERQSPALWHRIPSVDVKGPPARLEGTQKLIAERNKVVHIDPSGQSSP